MATLSPEQRLAVKRLKKTPIVTEISYNYYRIFVKFANRLKEFWILRDHFKGNPRWFAIRIPLKNLLTEYRLPVYSEFETHPLDEEEQEFLRPFFIIQRSDIKKAGFVDIRLAVHSLIARLLSEGWIDLKYPKSFLKEDLERLRQCDSNRFFVSPDTMSAYLKYGHPHLSTEGRTLVEHFLKWGNYSTGGRTLKDAWANASCLHGAIQTLLETEKDITRSNVVRYLGIGGGNRHSGPKFINPGFFYSAIKNFFISTKTIYDHQPGFGSKMLAASLMECEYVPNGGEFKEMASFVGCKIGVPQDRYDLAILSDIDPLKSSEALPLLDEHLRKSKSTLILVHRDSREEVTGRYPPRKQIKVQLCPNFLLSRMGYHYFLIY
jgi:hypothetical protein